jgi:hypothetical protein
MTNEKGHGVMQELRFQSDTNFSLLKILRWRNCDIRYIPDFYIDLPDFLAPIAFLWAGLTVHVAPYTITLEP